MTEPGMYGDFNIDNVECRYIYKGYASVSTQCSDFPGKCLTCKYNKPKIYKGTVAFEVKSHYKYFGDK
jgi:hypothetical protein